MMRALVISLALMATPAMAQDLTPHQEHGKELFIICGYCHSAGGTGTIILSQRMDQNLAILENRTDLDGSYVRSVVRIGLNSMPMFNRVELSDDGITAIVDYLTRNNGGE